MLEAEDDNPATRLTLLQIASEPRRATAAEAKVYWSRDPYFVLPPHFGVVPATIYGSGFWGRNAKSLLAETDGF